MNYEASNCSRLAYQKNVKVTPRTSRLFHAFAFEISVQNIVDTSLNQYSARFGGNQRAGGQLECMLILPYKRWQHKGFEPSGTPQSHNQDFGVPNKVYFRSNAKIILGT